VSELDRDQLEMPDEGGASREEVFFSARPVWPAMQSSAETTVFANTILSQFIADIFYVSFGQVIPPYFEGMSVEEVREQFQTLPVKVLSRFAITPDKMRELIQVLETNYDRWAERHGGPPREVQQ
jgi:hypothetical protein